MSQFSVVLIREMAEGNMSKGTNSEKNLLLDLVGEKPEIKVDLYKVFAHAGSEALTYKHIGLYSYNPNTFEENLKNIELQFGSGDYQIHIPGVNIKKKFKLNHYGAAGMAVFEPEKFQCLQCGQSFLFTMSFQMYCAKCVETLTTKKPREVTVSDDIRDPLNTLPPSNLDNALSSLDSKFSNLAVDLRINNEHIRRLYQEINELKNCDDSKVDITFVLTKLKTLAQETNVAFKKLHSESQANAMQINLNSNEIKALEKRSNTSEAWQRGEADAILPLIGRLESKFATLQNRLESLENAEKIRELESLENAKKIRELETIEIGVPVWSKTTGSGPWIAIAPSEMEVGLELVGKPNLNVIPRTKGWVVRGQDGLDTLFPEGDLTLKPQEQQELSETKALNPISWYTKLILAISAALIGSFLYLHFLV